MIIIKTATYGVKNSVSSLLSGNSDVIAVITN